MTWKQLTIGKKITLGFGITLIMMVAVGFVSFSGIGEIIINAEQVIEGHKLDSLLAQKEVDHLTWLNSVNTSLLNKKLSTIKIETNDHNCGLGKWLYGEGRKHAETILPNLAPFLKKLEAPHRSLHESAKQIFQQGLSDTSQAISIYNEKTIPALMAIRTSIDDIRAEAKKGIMTDEVMLGAARTTNRNVTIVVLVAIFIGIVLAFVIGQGISKALSKVASQLDDGADQVASASGEVSQSSQSLAEGASEQAASIEETSSSLEEMSSMTAQNAEHANQADNLMKGANQVIIRANQSMEDLTHSMQQISKASEETSKINKTIDEIAFQTNLLALNAAVEAARAGEAGAGFAVVADEVRNLAMRAAEAAKNTAGLIDGTVKKIGDGSHLVDRTNEEFAHVAESVSKVGDLVAEIASASSEQSQGIEQVNKTVSEMDKVTQQNAASSEESASASEEMSAQAVEMKNLVAELATMVNGNSVNRKQQPAVKMTKAIDSKNTVDKQRPETNQTPSSHTVEKEPSKHVIPFDDDVFEDF